MKIRNTIAACILAVAAVPVPLRAASDVEEFSRSYGIDRSRVGAEQHQAPSPPAGADPSTREFVRSFSLNASTNAVLSQALDIQNRRRSVPSPIDEAPDAFKARYSDYLDRHTLISLLTDLKRKAASPGTPDAQEMKRLEALLHLLLWNHFALDMTSLDHSTRGVGPVEPTYAEQFGPPRASRALAIVHLAMFEAANVIEPKYSSYKAPGKSGDIRLEILNTLQGQLSIDGPTIAKASIPAAVTAAAYQTLVALYPKKASILDTNRLSTLILLPSEGDDPSVVANGTTIGELAAKAVLAARQNDGSSFAGSRPLGDACQVGDTRSLCLEPRFPSMLPPATPATALEWRPDPISQIRTKLGETWSDVTPFVLSKHQFLGKNPDGTDVLIVGPGPSGRHAKPKDTDPDFIESLDKDEYGGPRKDPRGGTKQISQKYGVRAFGGYNDTKSPIDLQFVVRKDEGPRWNVLTKRDEDLTARGNYWGYDGTALLCAPPRMYNMIATTFALGKDHAITEVVPMARYLALVNLSLADAGVAAWDAKYQFNIARPTSFIRSKDPTSVALPGSGPDGHWTPLGQAATNGTLINISPPFPAYPSGHAVFGAALFQTIARIYGKKIDDPSTSFLFVSDEYNGVNLGADQRPRPLVPVTFSSFEAAEWENAESRIWLGIHWQKDADDGIALGHEVADAVIDGALKPAP